jgi:phage tail sheath protein FI
MPISQYQTPGIYMQEVSSGAQSVQPVGTSTAAFLGVAPNPNASLNKAVFIDSYLKFVQTFVPLKDAVSTPLSLAVHGFFMNGGSACYVVNLGPGGSVAGTDRPKTGLKLLEAIDEVAIVAAPGFYGAEVYDAILSHCETMGDRFAILDFPSTSADMDLEPLKQIATVNLSLPAAAGGGKGAKAGAGDGDGGAPPPAAPASFGLKPRLSENGFGAVYFPWLVMADPFGKPDPVTRNTPQIAAPPSGHIAGIYARADATRGVHKAPANEVVADALALTYSVTSAEQAQLNPLGINCIRRFNNGLLVWGARTLADGSSEWRYVPVKRTFLMIEESIVKSTRWIVFEPNDEPLWKRVRFTVEAFLTRVWRDGALMGRTAEEAFFVKCDRDTNPPENIDAGVVTIVIGIAPVKPAEFVVFRIGQQASGSTVTTL